MLGGVYSAPMRAVKILSLVAILVTLASACAPSPANALDGSADAGNPCDQLVGRTCDADAAPNACETEPSCEAARLTRLYEPQNCSARLNDTARYKPCGSFNSFQAGADNREATSCDDLIRKVCGSGQACDGQDACTLARDIQDPRTCDQAMGDETSFPSCSMVGTSAGAPPASGNGGGDASAGSGGSQGVDSQGSESKVNEGPGSGGSSSSSGPQPSSGS